ncbi:YIP1 family protein [Acetobacterium woodii]|uniref:Putative membrane protein n=1 Tax=Acetobacterium woodii (strain ATCC 29683 / DSM 1030 / JCM 2381 / KCTC 1655 / WB1) TaxID=931626 RepID=H6LCS0_ACEWD|nr:YIP1 family protein [Acetobacterium woodii]AFA49057.1 putative membrane protein [Acetobacterium woodii DSM 1030]
MNYLNLLINPVKFFKQVAEKEKVSLLIPIVILLIIVGLTAVLAGAQVSTLDIPAEQQGLVKGMAIGGGIISVIIGLAIAVMVKAAIFNLVLKKMGGEGSFKIAAYIVGLTYFPKIFQTILNIVFLKPIDIKATAEMDWVAFFAGIFSVFNIWQIVLTIIGLAVVYQVSYKKAAIPVIGLEIVSAGLTLGSTLLALKSAAGLSTLS